MFGPLGVPEMIFILLLALLVFGPKRLPEIGRTLGKGIGEFRRASNELKRSINTELALEEPPEPPPYRAPRIEPPPLTTARTASPTATTAPVLAAPDGPPDDDEAEEPGVAPAGFSDPEPALENEPLEPR